MTYLVVVLLAVLIIVFGVGDWLLWEDRKARLVLADEERELRAILLDMTSLQYAHLKFHAARRLAGQVGEALAQ